MRKIYLSILSVLLFAASGLGQTVMSNVTQTGVCSGTYYDPGGTLNYNNNLNFTQTFTPSAGNRMSFNFTTFATERGFDFLTIYNGPNTTYPILGTYSGTTAQGPGIVSSTANDGSLTFKFSSDANTVGSGWIASISCVPVQYRDQWISMNTGAATWCAGETRTVQVTVKNTGTQAWADGGGKDFNIGVKWNADADYFVRTDVANLASGASQTFNLTVTAPLTTGTNNLTFDIVYEGIAWFGNNNGAPPVGPGNMIYTSPAITINALPTAPVGTSSSRCGPGTVALSATTVAGQTIDWYANATGGTALTSGSTTFTTPSISTTTTYYAERRNTTTGCVSPTRTAITATVNAFPGLPSGTTGSRCGTGSVIISATPGAGETIDWYATSINGSALTTGSTTFATPSISTATTYYAESRNTTTGCKSATRTAVIATVNALPVVPGGTDNSRCGTGTVILNATPSAGETIDWYAGPTGGLALLTGNTSFTTPSLSSTTIYYAESRNTTTGCKSATRTAVTATVNITAVPTGASPQPFCASDNPTIASLTVAGNNIKWYNAPTVGTLYSNSDPLVNNTHYYASQTDAVTGCESATRLDITVIVNPPVVIATQPNPTQTICASSPVTFSVSATGGIGYQWYLGAALVVDDGNTTGSQTATLKILEVNPSDAGLYHVVITGNAPCANATSGNAELIVNETITFTTQPATPQTLCVGSTATFTGVSTGTGVTYLWRKGAVFLTDGGNISGAATNVLTLTNITAADAGTYNVQASDGTSGCPNRFSANAVLNINATSVGGTVTANASVCSGINGATLSLGGKTGTVDNWQSSLDGTAWTDIGNAGSNTQAYLNLTQTTQYRAVVHNGVCPADYSVPAVITVNELPTITTAASAADICFSSTAQTTSLAYSATTNAPTTYSITWSGTFVAVTDAPLNPGTITINVPANAPAGTYTGTLTVKNANGCKSSTGITFTVTVIGNATVNRSSATGTDAQVKCINNAITPITYAIGGTGTSAVLTGGLPTGVTGTFNAGVFTISGTPTVAGTFNYTVTTVGPCANPSLNGSITVNDDATISLSSAPATTSQTVCISTPITPITYLLGGGATGATLSGQPAGVTGLYNSGTKVYTISGTPSVSGTFNYTVTSTGPCVKPALTGSIIVQANSTVTLSSAAGTNIQTRCINNAITNIVYTIGGGATNANVTGLPAGVTGSLAGNVFTISGAPTSVVGSPFSYTVTATGPCVNASLSGTITVNNDATISLSSAPATTSQTKCISTPISNITYSIGGSGTGATVTGLPTGLTTGFSGGTFTISGSPTQSGTFTYTVTASGPCVKPALSGTITVQANSVITRTSSAGSTAQSVCINNPITPITYSITGGGTGASITAGTLPAGVSGTFSGGVFTISGTPTVSGAFSYTVTTSGPCVNSSLSGTITVNDNATISLTSSAGTDNQTKCINTGITPITYSIGGFGSTGAAVTGLPTGVTGNYNGGSKVFTISGTPSVSGTFNYTVTTTGPCARPIATGTITVTPNSTIVLSSAGGTDGQTVCMNVPITNITYTFGGSATGANVTGLPAGITSSTSGNVLTISGAPTTSTGSPFSYTVTTTGPCVQASKSGSVTVLAAPTGTLTPSATTICAGQSVTFTFTPALLPAGTGSYIFKLNGTGTPLQTGTSNTYSTATLNNGDFITVDVANASNCGATFTSVPVTVTPLPVATLKVTENSGTTNDNTICAGDNITFTALPAGGTNYNFKVDGVSVYSGPLNYFSSTTITNNQSVTVDVTKGCVGVSAAQIITVNPIPSGTFSATNPTAACEGGNFAFSANGGSSYQFRVDGAIAQAWSSTNTFSLPATLSVNGSVVTVEVANGPTGTGCTTIYTPGIPVNVNPLPTGTITVTENSGTPNDNIICANAPVTFTFPTGYSIYDFRINGDSKQSGPSNTFLTTLLTNTSDEVTVLVSSGSSCSATFTAPVITVVSSPLVTLSISPLSTICAGDNVTFTATPLNATFNYAFSINGTPVQNGIGVNTFSTSMLAQGDIVTVEVTNTNSCATVSNAFTMTVNPLPTGTLVPVENAGIANDGIICTGTSVVFTIPVGFTNYNFLLNGASVQNGNSNTYTNSTLVTGDKVTVALTNAGGCIGLSNEKTITVNPLPAVAAITGIFNVCIGSTSSLINTAGGSWSSSNTAIATVDPTSGIVTGVTVGPVTMTYTTAANVNGCTNSTSALVTVNPLPVVAPITGNFNICTGFNSQLSDATYTGGTWVWSSDDGTIAGVDANGLVTGNAGGTANISYKFTDAITGCSATVTTPVIVADQPEVAPITAPSGLNVCIGGNLPLKDVNIGGTWSSSNTAVATVSASGVVTGLTSGTTDITYSIITSCGPDAVSDPVTITVNAPPSATITYASGPYCTSAAPITVTRTGTPGGTYSATGGLAIDPATGTITPGITGGTYTITYTIAASGGCGVYTTTTNVTITTAPSATIAYAGPYCTSSTAATPTWTGTTGGTYSSTAGLSIASNGTINPSLSTAGTYTVTYTIGAANGCAQFTTDATVTITAAPSGTISYAGSPLCTGAAPVLVSGTATPGGTYSYTGAGTLSINATTGTITPATSTNGTYTVIYTITGSGVCATFTATTTVTITAAPTSVAGTPIATCSNTGAVNITAGASAPNSSSVVWTSNGTGTFANANSLTNATYTPSATDITAGSRILTLTANGNGSCGTATSTKTITISAVPDAFIITPASATLCLGDVQPLTATASTVGTGSVTISSGTINIGIPDGNDVQFCIPFVGCFTIYTNPGSITTNLSVTTVPANAVINSMSVKFNVNHTYDGDLVLNLKAPNGNVLNLVNNRGGNGDNFTNTTISSTGITPVNTGSAPFTATYSADAKNSVGAPNSNNNINFSNLFSTPNGTWTFGAEDDKENDIGTIKDWSITFNYTIPVTPLAVTWSPVTDLYTDATLATGYTGQAQSTVYAKPSTATNATYTATTTNASSCSTAQTVVLTVNAAPVVTITANYCNILYPGKVELTATSTPAATGFVWSTGDTGPTIIVDISGDYDVTAFVSTGCPGKATINVSQELVKNGNFEQGNVGFTTPPLGANQYQYRADVGGNSELQPEGLYGVGTNPQNYHSNFWGKDHTTGFGKFMIINGFPNGNPQPIVWQETVSVLPNTTYYFSAWGMSLNNAGPFAKLQFNVNGAQVGSQVTLAPGVENNGNNGWQRFYGTLTTGPTTTSAVISITDLQNSPGGNDFGLDDISFATLSTFITLESAPGTDAQTVCKNSSIAPIIYNVGNGSSTGPTVTGLPPGITTSPSPFAGDKLTFTGTPTVAGNYTYSITTTGCNPTTVTGTITVQEDSIKLTSGSAAPVCKDVAMPNLVYTVGGTANGASIPPGILPAGVKGAYDIATKTFTISGTPTAAAGVYPYTITTSGTCPGTEASIRGTITIQAQSITLTSVPATINQTKCINTAITNIQYTVGGTGAGAIISWSPSVPTGIIETYQTGIYTIKGTPTVSGQFTYTVTTTGICTGVTATGIINVTPAASMVLTSANDNQTVCTGNSIAAITYNVVDATNASITSGALPAGVTGTYNAGVFTISGKPTITVGGTFNYTITTSGGCATATASGTITVNAQTVVLSTGNASPSVCQNAPMTPIVYTISGLATGASLSWQSTSLEPSVTGVYDAGTKTFTISGTPTAAAGAYAFTVTTIGTCGQATATGAITITALAVSGSISAPANICSGGTGSLTVLGNSSNPVRWESSPTGAAPWTSIPNTTITLNYTNVTSALYYRAIISNGCGEVPSNAVLVGVHNLWTGLGADNNWNTTANWSDNKVPDGSCPNVRIPGGTPRQPLINSGTVTVQNLQIDLSATVTVATTATLQVSGALNNQGGLDVTAGTLEFNGTAAQNVATTTNIPVKDLLISNNTTVTLAGPASVDVYTAVNFSGAGKTLDAGDGNLTIKSSVDGTGQVGDLTGRDITGNVRVERYINTLGHGKAWEFLAIPTKGQTVKQSWMENGILTSTGYGTQIVDPAGPAKGFDAAIPLNPSMKYYDATVAGSWKGIDNTGIPIYDSRGYMVFVRGDRSVDGVTNKIVNATTLRTKGTLIKGPQAITISSGTTDLFASVGNPFASAIDMRKVMPVSTNVTEFFTVWDPYATGAYGVGAYITYTQNPVSKDYEPTPAGAVNNSIQSGQAFFVQLTASGTGTMNFSEPSKISGSNITFFRPQGTTGRVSQLRTNMYALAAGGSKVLVDGTLQQFGEDFSNGIDEKDARKITNSAENLSITSGGKSLIVERRKFLGEQDTVFYKMSGVKIQKYQFEFIATGLSAGGLEGFVEDTYLKTRTTLNMEGSTLLEYAVTTDKASSASNRFRIVFKTAVVLPVTFVSVTAHDKNGDVAVEWKVENESAMKQYEVEKSTDGARFVHAATNVAGNTGAASYSWLDQKATPGYNYYRIRSTDLNGKINYSEIVKVLIQVITPEIKIYPNPITNGVINLHLINQPGGTYYIRLMNPLGQTIVAKQVTRAQGSTIEHIQWNYNLAHGTYQLQVTKPSGELKVINVIY